MTYKKKTWQEKMQDKEQFPKKLELELNFPCAKALQKMGAKKGDSVVLVNPREVDGIMKKVPKGKLITLNEICRKLAKKYKTKFCCTLTAGIFVNISANAAEETKSQGKKRVTPYWRTLKNDGFLNEKFPGGAKNQKKLLEQEGHEIIKRGKRYQVKNFKRSLVKF